MNKNFHNSITQKVPSIFRSELPLLFALVIILSACKSNETGPNNSPIDPVFVGVWYASSDAVGFEVLADGTSKTLVVDTAGKLQYSTPGPSLASAISLTIIEAKNGNLKADIRYKVTGFIDTTVTVPGVYVFSNNNSIVSITFPHPQTDLQTTMVFERSSIGALVKQKTISDFSPQERRTVHQRA